MRVLRDVVLRLSCTSHRATFATSSWCLATAAPYRHSSTEFNLLLICGCNTRGTPWERRLRNVEVLDWRTAAGSSDAAGLRRRNSGADVDSSSHSDAGAHGDAIAYRDTGSNSHAAAHSDVDSPSHSDAGVHSDAIAY